MTAENTIRELINAYLADTHKVRGVEFIDQLLQVVLNAGQVRFSQVYDQRLCFQIPGQAPVAVEVDRAKAKLRMLCARLGVLCNESGDAQVSLYGGEGVILGPTSEAPVLSPSEKAAQNGPGLSRSSALDCPPRARLAKWSVRFKNTPSEQEFTIVAE